MTIPEEFPTGAAVDLFDAILAEARDDRFDGAPDGGGMSAAVRGAIIDGGWIDNLVELIADDYYGRLCVAQRTSSPTLPSE